MNSEHSNEWIQYKKNPHIQYDRINSHFRCSTCKMELGVNAGGAASHSKGSHGIKLDGTQITIPKEIKVEPNTIESEETVTEEKNLHSHIRIEHLAPTEQINSDKQPKLPEEHKSITEDPLYNIYKTLERKMHCADLYKRAKMAGIPKSQLEDLERELGITEEEERKKKEKMRRERKDDEELFRQAVILMAATEDPTVKRNIFMSYVLSKNT